MEENNTQQPTPQQSPSDKPYNLEPNIAAALSYLVPPLTGIVFVVLEKEDKFVRFHAFQSIVFGVAAWIASIVAGAIPFLNILLSPIVAIAIIILWLLLMWKAYNHKEYELPVLGKIARDRINN